MGKIFHALGLACMIASTSFGVNAEKAQMTYGYCGEPSLSVGSSWQGYTAVVVFPEEFVDKFDGATVTAVQIASPDNALDPSVNNFTSIDLCFYDRPGGEVLYHQPATLSDKGFEWKSTELTTPWVIEKGKPFCVGYYGLAPTVDDYCFAVDYEPNNGKNGMWLGWTDEESGEEIWEPYTEYYGNMCLRLVVEGDNLPSDEINVEGFYGPGNVITGKEFSILAAITNKAANEVESLTLEYKIGNRTDTIEAPVVPALGYGKSADVRIPGLVCDITGNRVGAYFKVLAVNGNPDAMISMTGENVDILLSLPEGVGYDRNVLIEEGTGTWCGYCPMGIVGIDYMKQKYTDGSFIPVAIHGNDPMESDSYISISKEYFTGYPSMVVNRNMLRLGVLQPETPILEAAYQYVRSIPAYVNVSSEVDYAASSRDMLKVLVKTQFAIPTSDNYHVEAGVTQNNVGPYLQTNYFSDGYEEMGGFEQLDEYVPMMYSDVARTLVVGDAVGNKPGEVYETAVDVPLSDLTSTTDFAIVVMVVNDTTGEVENAVMIPSDKLTGVAVPSEEKLAVTCEGNEIIVEGCASAADVYAIDGRKIGSTDASGRISVAPGMYVVVAGGSSVKVMVK